MEKDKIINVVYSSDNNYIPHAAASIVSLVENNKSFEKINIYFIQNCISVENRDRLESLTKRYEQLSIIWLDFSKWIKQLELNMEWNISISAYARLLITEMLKNDINKVLYLDCDIIINQSIEDLWNIDIA